MIELRPVRDRIVRQAARRLRRPDAVAVGAGVVIVAGLVVRWHERAVQSYYTDESFSVFEAHSSSVRQVVRIGLTEVHTPMVAVLLHLWIVAGGTHRTAWVRALPVLVGGAAVPVTLGGLRGAGLTREAWWLCGAATSASALLVLYSQEVRPYAFLILGVVGLTATGVRLRARAVRTGGSPPGRRESGVWTAWALFTATSHLLGAVLVVVSVGDLLHGVRGDPAARRRRLVRALSCLAVAVAPQAAWLLAGSLQPGFAEGTDWIQAPHVGDVGILATSVFAAGGLSPRADGFAWTGPWGVLVVVGLVVLAVVVRARSGRSLTGDAGEPGAQPAGQPAGDLLAARLLLTRVVVMGVLVFATAQLVHIWTLRNMIAVVPAALWGSACLCTGLAGSGAGRRLVAGTALLALGGSLVVTAHDLSSPYKTDWRTGMTYLTTVRRRARDTMFVFLAAAFPRRDLMAVDATTSPEVMRHLFDRAELLPRNLGSLALLRRTREPEVVFYYPGVQVGDTSGLDRAIASRLGSGCAPVPVHGLAIVACPADQAANPGTEAPNHWSALGVSPFQTPIR